LVAGHFGFAQIKGFIGVTGGGQFSNAYIEHTVYNTFMNTGFIPGYNAGMMLKLFTNQNQASFLNAGVQTGLSLSRKGWRQTFDTANVADYRVRMTYLNLPIEAFIYFGKRKTKPFFTLGMYVEYLTNVKKDPLPPVKLKSGAPKVGQEDFYTYESSRDRKFGYGVRVSVGVQREFSFGLIHLDGFFKYGISNFLYTKDLSNRLPDISNFYVAGFTVGYLLPFGKMKF